MRAAFIPLHFPNDAMARDAPVGLDLTS